MKRNMYEELSVVTESIKNLSSDVLQSLYNTEGKISKMGAAQSKIKSQILVKKLHALQKLLTYISTLKYIDN